MLGSSWIMPLFEHLEGLTFGNLNWHLWMGCKYFLFLVVNVHYLKVDNFKGLASFWYVVYVVFLCVWRFEVWHLAPPLTSMNGSSLFVVYFQCSRGLSWESPSPFVYGGCILFHWRLTFEVDDLTWMSSCNVDCFHYWMLAKLSYNIYV